jgi:hypothetical protein
MRPRAAQCERVDKLMVNVEAVQYVVLALQVLIDLGTLAAALLLRHYLPAYIAKKGKNVARKGGHS